MNDERVELSEGQPAPEIAATVTGGDAFRLSDQRGRWVVVYIYPRALSSSLKCNDASCETSYESA